MSQEDLLARIERLEAENRRLRERANDSGETLRTLIRKLPAPAAAIGPDLDIIQANGAFVALAGYRGTRLAEANAVLRDVPLAELLPAELYGEVETAHRAGEDIDREDVVLEGIRYTFSVFNIRRGELTVVVLRSLADPNVRAQELAARLNGTVDRNIQMIQQIAFLLGEEVSENAKVIGSVIRALGTAAPENHER